MIAYEIITDYMHEYENMTANTKKNIGRNLGKKNRI